MEYNMNNNGSTIISGVPEGLEAGKIYKCYFSGTGYMTIVDEPNNASFTLVYKNDKWETGLKTPLSWTKKPSNVTASYVSASTVTTVKVEYPQAIYKQTLK